MRRRLLGGLLLSVLPLLTGCSEDDGGSGSLRFVLSGEGPATAGYPFVKDGFELAFDRGWTVQFDHIGVSSYEGDTTSGSVKIQSDLSTEIEGKHVIVVEDIVDTGITASYLLRKLRERQPATLKLAALLSKPDRRRVDVNIDYTGFTIPDEFVVGYGLDREQRFRNLPFIGVFE